MITVHGIKNCDTVKKARQWLTDNGVDYQFRDVRELPLTADEVKQWLTQIPATTLINKRSSSWRALSEQQQQLQDSDAIANLIVAHPTLFKRPLVDNHGKLSVGFNAQQWQQQLSAAT